MKRIFFPIIIFFLTACTIVSAAEVMVFAAASLSDALQEIRVNYEADQEDRITYNFESSSKLVRQIIAGAPADVFFSADEEKMDQLQSKDLIIESTRVSVLSNSLVIVTPTDDVRINKPEDLLHSDISRIALAQPESVPAGIYAKSYLKAINMWDGLSEKIIPTENVRAALAVVESGNAEAGIVYRTDVRPNTKVRIAYNIPTDKTPSITYPIALTKNSANAPAARRFLDYIRSKESSAVFERHGFTVMTAK